MGVDDISANSPVGLDASRIRVHAWRPTIGALLARIAEGTVALGPGFRCEDDVWVDEVQSRLIESLLIRVPLPVFCLEPDPDERMTVIDGLQRLTALRRFVLL